MSDAPPPPPNPDPSGFPPPAASTPPPASSPYQPVPGAAPYQPVPGAAAVPVGANGQPLKSKMAAGLLGIFLGGFGVHQFYLGNKNKGLLMLLLSVLSCFILYFFISIWGLIEGIMILTGNPNYSTDADGNPLTQ